ARLSDLGVRRPRRAHRDLGHAVARVVRMRVRVDQPGGDQATGAVLVMSNRTNEVARLVTRAAAPGDTRAVEDDRRVRDHARVAAGEQAADPAQPPHPTTVLPPTTTCFTSRAEQQ